MLKMFCNYGETKLGLAPFLKWAGGKRWLVSHQDFQLPEFTGKYIEPFLGGGAVFFSLPLKNAILSDLNPRLIETYQVVRDEPCALTEILKKYHSLHNREFYYSIRDADFFSPVERAAQFLYLNRTCWNGLYRENLSGKFNVPIGTKTAVYSEREDFLEISERLRYTDIECCDFEKTISKAENGDLLFLDPPYTTAHNLNGFVKYNQNIFSWDDQLRLRNSALRASSRGAKVLITNANHHSITEIYADIGKIIPISRSSVISGKNAGRQKTSELLISLNL